VSELDEEFDFEDSATVVDMGLAGGPDLPPYPTLAVFGPFEILGRLARGGMAEVYLARETTSAGKPRHVVLKRILPERENDAEFIRMFRDEADLATRLFHPNICHVYECGEIDGTTFMTLEFVYGVTLRKVLRRAARVGGLPPRVAAHIIGKVADALNYVHTATGVEGRPLNIIHRDVSPHNIMIGWDGRVKLLDFGIAKTTSQEADTEAGVLKGKYAYLSPEQARGKPLDGRSDIFSLGICLYEALTSRPLYHQPGMLQTLEAIVRGPVPSPLSVTTVAPELDAITQRALQKRPTDRFATAAEMKEAIDDFLWRDGGAFVSPKEVADVLQQLFPDEGDRSPLPENASQLTGSFGALTGSLQSIVSGSFGPFGSGPRPVDDGVQPMLASSERAIVTGKHAPVTADVPIVAEPRRKKRTLLLVGAIVLVGLAAGVAVAFLYG